MAASPTPTSLPLRLAVVVGAAALLAGTVGFVRLVLEERDGPGPLPRLHLRGLPPGAALDVSVRWQEGGEEVREPAVRGSRAGEWILPRPPRGRAVTIVVEDLTVSPPRLLAEEVLGSPPPPLVALDLDDGASPR